MKNPIRLSLVVLALVFSSEVSFALQSPFPSTVRGIGIPNTHRVDREGRILRGSTPDPEGIDELVAADVTDILIFKNDTRGEVEAEIEALREAGFSSRRIVAIPFRWKDPESFAEACRQTMAGLRLMARVAADPDRKLFLHCTVGEDRTGLLSGLYRMIDQGWTLEKAFRDELCLNGYEAGNPQKPRVVVQAIREDLTPLFLALAERIEAGDITLRRLSGTICDGLEGPAADPADYQCRRSSRYRRD